MSADAVLLTLDSFNDYELKILGLSAEVIFVLQLWVDWEESRQKV
jgi:alkyl hydroperoxide reductase subunit AhpC